MTRLKPEWIKNISSGLAEYDIIINEKIGLSLAGLAAKAAGISEDELEKKAQNFSVYAIPVTTGKGEISGFSETVAAILGHIGACAKVATDKDVVGIAQAAGEGADAIFLADDNSYMAINLKAGKVSDNNEATARGYAAALESMAGGLEDKDVLLVGCGLVGNLAARDLQAMGARLHVCDRVDCRAAEFAKQYGCMQVVYGDDISVFSYIYDATNEGGWLDIKQIAKDAIIASPGVPSSVSEDGAKVLGKRWIHDELEIGTAVMLADILCGE